MTKHKISSIKKVLEIYGKNLKVILKNYNIEYVNLIKISQIKSEFLINSNQNLCMYI